MRACNDIEFLNSYWSEAKNVAFRIEKELPQFTEPNIKSSNGTLMYIVNYSDLGNSWDVKDILSKNLGQSPTLKILANKIAHMIYRGNADSVKPMIEKIISGRFKHFSKPVSEEMKKRNMEFGKEYGIVSAEPLGFGHFRWDNIVHTLTQAELNHIKKYFRL